MKKKQFRILCLFDYKCTTGFATVSQNIIPRLRRIFGDQMKLTIIAINYHGDPFLEDKNTSVNPAAHIGAMPDAFGRYEFIKMLSDGDYEGIFVIQDPNIFLPMIPVIKKVKDEKKAAGRKLFKTIFYFPLDGVVIPEWFEHIDFIDYPVTYTDYAKEEVLNLKPHLKTKLEVIYHGNNPNHFYPIDEENLIEFREAYFGDNKDKTIFINVNRNQPRKDIPTTIFAFEYYLRTHNPDAFLYLHMNPEDEAGWNLHTVIRQTSLKIGRDFMFMPQDLVDNHPEPQFLNCVYNCSDFYITTSTGEGWGLGVTESMASQTPVICPDHSSLSEICNVEAPVEDHRAWTLKPSRPYVTDFDNMIRGQVDYKEFAALMHKAVNDPIQTEIHVMNAFQFTRQINWERICDQWAKIFRKAF